MRDEIIKGMLGGLVIVVIAVSIGSFIGFSTSHGPEEKTEAAAEGEAGKPEADPLEPGGAAPAGDPTVDNVEEEDKPDSQ